MWLRRALTPPTPFRVWPRRTLTPPGLVLCSTPLRTHPPGLISCLTPSRTQPSWSRFVRDPAAHSPPRPRFVRLKAEDPLAGLVHAVFPHAGYDCTHLHSCRHRVCVFTERVAGGLAGLSLPLCPFPHPFPRRAYMRLYVGCASYVWLSSGSCRVPTGSCNDSSNGIRNIKAHSCMDAT